MRFYRTRAGNWEGTQADAKRIAREDGSAGNWQMVEVPTEKAALLDWLKLNFPLPVDASPSAPTAAPPSQVADSTNETARRITVEEEIQSCGLPRLAVMAENVAWRFHELAKAAQA